MTHTLPGTLEFPFAANEVVETNPDVDAIVCLAVVLKGDTYHFEMIIDECVRGLGDVSRAARVPIVNEVLPVTDLADAEARAGRTTNSTRASRRPLPPSKSSIGAVNSRPGKSAAQANGACARPTPDAGIRPEPDPGLVFPTFETRGGAVAGAESSH